MLYSPFLSLFLYYFCVYISYISLLFLYITVSVFEIRVKRPYDGGIFEHRFTATKPESMLNNHSSSVIILSYFEHWSYIFHIINQQVLLNFFGIVAAANL